MHEKAQTKPNLHEEIRGCGELTMYACMQTFYMFGDAVIGPAVMMFAFMPAVVLTSKLVPKGLESTTYALLAGFQNFGGVVSSQIGIFATQVC
jgi:hypothetical protein